MDTTKLHFASTVGPRAWISSERRQAIQEENRRNDLVRRPGTSWQNFDISLKTPEPFYSAAQYWFKIGEYSTSSMTDMGNDNKTYLCRYSVEMKRRLLWKTLNRTIALVVLTSTSTTRRTIASRTLVESSERPTCTRLLVQGTSTSMRWST